MKSLIVYGTNRSGEYKCIFGMLAPLKTCITNAKKTAKQHGYEITKVELNAAWNEPFKDVTDQFMAGEITELD